VRVWSPTLSFCPCYGALPALPSFPTRRSSDLAAPSGPPSVRRADRPVWWRATVRALAGRTLAAGRRYPGTELCPWPGRLRLVARSEEHTSELQSRENLVCRLLLEKKKSHRHIE